MNPDEKHLLERTFRLSEENNRLLKKFDRRARWAIWWGVLKVAFIVIPLILGYLFIRPHIDEASAQFQDAKDAFEDFRNLPF